MLYLYVSNGMGHMQILGSLDFIVLAIRVHRRGFRLAWCLACPGSSVVEHSASKPEIRFGSITNQYKFQLESLKVHEHRN